MSSKRLIRNILLLLIAFSFTFKIQLSTIPIVLMLVLNIIEGKKEKASNFKLLVFSIICFSYFLLFLFSFFLGFVDEISEIAKKLGFILLPLLFLVYNTKKRELDFLMFQYFFIFLVLFQSIYYIIISVYLANKSEGNLIYFNEELIKFFILERPYYAIIINIASVSLISLFTNKNKLKKSIALFIFIIFNLSLILVAAKIGVFINLIFVFIFIYQSKWFKSLILITLVISIISFIGGSYLKSRLVDISNDPRELIWNCNYKIISNKSFNIFIGNFSNEITQKQLNNCYDNEESLKSKHFWIGKFNYNYNSHNQYLSIYTNFGLIGLFLLLILLIIPSFDKKKFNLYVLIFFISSIFENILDRQLGIFLFLWFFL